MGIVLRPAQVEVSQMIDNAFNHSPVGKAVIAVLPTGAGKTILMAHEAAKELSKGGMVVIFAHRDVLLEQISSALCLYRLEHTFITSKPTQNNITTKNLLKFGNSFYNERARIIVASVDTFYRRDLTMVAPYITKWMMDETHHLLDDSKWHKCIEQLVNARGLGVTATPIRADKKGLGREYDGVFDEMIEGMSMHKLITDGTLSPYRVYAPPMRVDLSGVNTTSSGDYNQKKLAKATDNDSITGDAVEHYLRLAQGKQAICFTVNIVHGEHVAEQFRKAGVKAVNLSSKTPSAIRDKEIERFRRGEIDILVNCDLFGEGFDVPAVEVVIMLRKTQSYALFKQQFGRALRVCDGKEYGIIIDHVGNVQYFMAEFGLQYPHDDPPWTLARPDKKRRKNGDNEKLKPVRVCPKCRALYAPVSQNGYQCPYCHHTETKEEEIDALKAFQAKEGNLVEMEIDVIQQLMKKSEEVMIDPSVVHNKMKYANAPSVVVNSAVSNHKKRRDAQILLRNEIQKWCVAQFENIPDVKAVQNQFEIQHGINIFKAQSLSERESILLLNKLQNKV